MTHKAGKTAFSKPLVELRREGMAGLTPQHDSGRLSLYEQYFALSKTFDVKLAGPFLVIKGGQPAD